MFTPKLIMKFKGHFSSARFQFRTSIWFHKQSLVSQFIKSIHGDADVILFIGGQWRHFQERGWQQTTQTQTQTQTHPQHVQLSTMGERGVSRLVSVLLSSASLSLSLLLLSLSKHTCRFTPPCSLENTSTQGAHGGDQESCVSHIPK